jgi:hypothetical protein
MGRSYTLVPIVVCIAVAGQLYLFSKTVIPVAGITLRLILLRVILELLKASFDISFYTVISPP